MLTVFLCPKLLEHANFLLLATHKNYTDSFWIYKANMATSKYFNYFYDIQENKWFFDSYNEGMAIQMVRQINCIALTSSTHNGSVHCKSWIHDIEQNKITIINNGSCALQVRFSGSYTTAAKFCSVKRTNFLAVLSSKLIDTRLSC